MVSHVTLQLDAVALTTVQSALALLQLNAQAALATISAQVQAQLAPPPAEPPANE